MTNTTMHVELREGETLHVGDAQITLSKKDGKRARFMVQAPRSTTIKHPKQQPSAHECAPTPEQGKEHTHGQHAV